MIFFILVFISGQAMAELALPTLMSDVVNNGMMQGDTGYILTYGAYMLLVALASTACFHYRLFLFSKSSAGIGEKSAHNGFYTC